MLYMIGGKNIYASSKELAALRGKFLKDHKNAVVKVINADETEDLSEITSRLEGISLFDEKPLYVVKRLQKGRKEIQESFSKFFENQQSPGDMIVWEDEALDKRKRVYKTIAKQGVVEEYDLLKPYQLKSWLQKEFRGHDLNVSSHVIDELIVRIGSDQMAFSHAVNLLVTYAQSEKKSEVTLEDVEALIPKTAEENIWEIIDALGERNRGYAIKKIDEITKELSSYLSLVGLIARQLRIIVQIKLLEEEGMPYQEMQRQLKMHPFVFKKAYNQSRLFSLNQLRTLYRKLVDTDYAVKTGLLNHRLAIDLYTTIF